MRSYELENRVCELATKAQKQAHVEYAEVVAQVRADLDRLQRNEDARAEQLLREFLKAELDAGEGS